MSIQLGRWEFDGRVVDPEFIPRASALTAKYASGCGSTRTSASVSFYFDPFRTTDLSDGEDQPFSDSTGALLTWDGRLDNPDELVSRLELSKSFPHTDAEIALTAYQRWGTSSFPALVGDWALSLWDPFKQALLLAKDFMGTRQLFYYAEETRVTWSTVLDPLVLLAGRSFSINEQFVAGFLAASPSLHLTPYVGINAVPAGTFVQFKGGRCATEEYWRFDGSHCIRYREDRDYEEHFRKVFGAAVCRRLRSSWPVLAELSGGMDSSSVVCVGDALFAKGKVECPRLDTVSYYDDQEPNWDERPFFSIVEKTRGREGYHLDIGKTHGAFLPARCDHFFPVPGADQARLNFSTEFAKCIQESHSRVLLSGVGGDEFLGGVPTLIPELQDLFVRLRWLAFARRLFEFGLLQRRPWTHACFDVAKPFLPRIIRCLYQHRSIPPWLTPAFVSHNALPLQMEEQRIRFTGQRPSFQSNTFTLNRLRGQLHCRYLDPVCNFRVSYPFLDRDLLTFLFAIPRSQLVRPGERRSLMRRALSGWVPMEILARRRKAFVARRPMALIGESLAAISILARSPLVTSLGWVDDALLTEAIESAKQGTSEQLASLHCVLKLELWLRSLVEWKAVDFAPTRQSQPVPNRLQRHGARFAV